MARPPRILFAGAIYHVFCRGNRRGEIFTSVPDRQNFLDRLAVAERLFGTKLISYCLMTNHYHLVIETPRGNLDDVMEWLNGRYARWFNLRYGYCGHLFERRYQLVLIKDGPHLLQECRYVVRNPVEAGICNDPADYAWSSYRATIGLAPVPPFLHPERLYGELGGATRAQAQELFVGYVLDAQAPARVAA